MAVTITGTSFNSDDGFSIGDLGTEPTAAFTRASDSKDIHLFRRTLDCGQFPLRGSVWNTTLASYYGTSGYSYSQDIYRNTNFPINYFEERIVQVGADPFSVNIFPFKITEYNVAYEYFWYEILATYYVGNTHSQTFACTAVGGFEKEGSTYTARNVQKSLTAYDYISSSNTALDLDNIAINTSPPYIQLIRSFNANGTNRTIWNVHGFSVVVPA